VADASKVAAQLYKALQKRLYATLEDDVAQDMVNALKDRAQRDVYDVYEPKTYERRYTLINDNAYRIDVSDRGLRITNTAQANAVRLDGEPSLNEGESVGAIVETGGPYEYDFEYDNVPRPFFANAVKDMRDGDFADSLRRGLKKRGVDVL
jgi:hypothetical protein